MHIYFSNNDYYSQAELKKIIKLLSKKIEAAKVGKASSSPGTARSKKHSTDLKRLRSSYNQSVAKLKRLKNQEDFQKIKQKYEKQRLEEEQRLEALKAYQKSNSGNYSYITNFNNSYKEFNRLKKSKIFNTYL
jgi:hypothetical protein